MYTFEYLKIRPLSKEEVNDAYSLEKEESICIHSVCVKESRRRQGLATHMLKEFIHHVQTEEKDAARILLICKSKLIPLYTRAGFVFKCKSGVVHGKDPWYELEVKINNINTFSEEFRVHKPSVLNGID